jgi:hypothetical protein
MQVSLKDVYSLIRINQLRNGTAGPVHPRSEPLGRFETGFWVSHYLEELHGPPSTESDEITRRCRALLH